MSIGLAEEHTALADSVAGFVARHAPRERTRAALDELAAGARPDHWDALVDQGLLSLHLPAEHGGADAGLLELAVVAEEAGFGLLPGPFLATVLTSAVLARPAADPVAKALLPRFAAGATGATALTTGGLTARRSGAGAGWLVDGSTAPVLGAVGAEIVLLGATGPDGTELWFVIDGPDSPDGPAGRAGIVAEPLTAVDVTRGIGRFTLTDLAVDDDRVVAVDAAAVRDVAAVLLSAEAVGLARWCLRTGVDYAKVREQFGQPIGAFQAIKHKCARMFVRVETMAAAAWDAARAADEDPGQFALAAAAAAVVCLPEARGLGLDTVTLLGGIGYTWEHDVHLYWRRAMVAENLLGPTSGWERRLGALARSGARNFDVELPEEDAAFRARIAATLAEVAALPEADRPAALAAAGLVLPHYPRPYGIEASPVEQLVIGQEYDRSPVTQPKTIVGEWALPTILAHGTDEQRDAFVPATLRGEIVWCQLFSEPGAGSDLASLATRATKVDGGWVLSGQKVWSSMAAKAHWGICLARTDPTGPKHKGISYFLVDMHAAGVDVRPLREANGGFLFNEVFLNDVFVPDDRLVGEPNKGWTLARTTLANERVSIGGFKHTGLDLAALASDEAIRAVDPDADRILGGVTARDYAIAALGLRATLRQLSGLRPGAESSVLKVASGLQRILRDETAMAWTAPWSATTPNAVDPGDRSHPTESGAALEVLGARAVSEYLSVPPQLLGGGTIEIQLNVISERILGLPRG